MFHWWLWLQWASWHGAESFIGNSQEVERITTANYGASDEASPSIANKLAHLKEAIF